MVVAHRRYCLNMNINNIAASVFRLKINNLALVFNLNFWSFNIALVPGGPYFKTRSSQILIIVRHAASQFASGREN